MHSAFNMLLVVVDVLKAIFIVLVLHGTITFLSLI